MKPNLTLTLILLSSIGFKESSSADTPPNMIVIYTDDHGYADLGLQGIVNDIQTPHTDALARSGVLMRHGYSTAPQCVPSRAGLLSGRFQSRFGLEDNGSSLEGFNRQTTIAQRLQKMGYVTAQLGKWHLGPTTEITKHGFTHVFAQNSQRPFSANITLDGKDRPMGDLPPQSYHIDGCSQAAAALIARYKDDPFFLYIAYRAPHVPLDAPKKYLDRFPGEMPQRRRQALAMISTVDDGVGLITEALKTHGIRERTLIFYIGDNGAPLKIHKADIAGGGPGWDGSLNDPLNGEKGMLSEGGIHVPFVISWPGQVPGGQIYEHPVSALDVAATACALAGIETQTGELDGVNLIPHLTGKTASPPHEFLAWRWIAQSAIREGDWKLLRGGQREYLFNLADDLEEKHNLAAQHPDIANRLRGKLKTWCTELDPPGLTTGPMAGTWEAYFDHYLDGKSAKPLRAKFIPGEPEKPESNPQGWQARNATLAQSEGRLVITPDPTAKGAPFIVRSGLDLFGPVTLTLRARSKTGGESAASWRAQGDKDFTKENVAAFDWPIGPDWQDVKVELPAKGRLIHLRLTPAKSATGIEIQSIHLRDARGGTQSFSVNTNAKLSNP